MIDVLISNPKVGDSQRVERRHVTRFNMRIPVEMSLPGSESTVLGITSDISSSGVRFVVSRDIETQREIEFILAFPPEISLSKTVKVRCKGKVMRVERDNPSCTGIAASIQYFKFLGESDRSYPFSNVRIPNTR